MHPDTAPIIEKWYQTLHFDPKYDTEFYEALHSISISPDTSIDTYPIGCADGKQNLLAFLYILPQSETAQHLQAFINGN